jgi:flagellin-like protein
MKGVSAVIATILMLMIVIALAGMAYMYLIGMFTARTSKSIDITYAGCTAGQQPSGYYVSIKSLDTTASINVATDLTARLDGNVVTLGGCTPFSVIGPGNVTNCNITGVQGGTSGSFHRITVVGPANSADEPANC